MAFPNYGELLLSSYSEQPTSAILRSEMETGPAKQAKVKSRVLVKRPLVMHYSNAQYILFKAWFKGEAQRGAAWFDFNDPIDDSILQVRIMNGDYQATLQNVPNGHEMQWQVSLTLESWDA